MTVTLRPVDDPAEKSAICAQITATLPAWFGQPASNEMYRTEIATKQVFAADRDGAVLGAIAVHDHFATTAEIWWMGVAAGHHRQGIGARLMAAALAQAAARGRTRAVLMTLSDRSPDPGYAATRAFYRAQGFAPLFHVTETDAVTPMMWMIRDLP